MSLARVVLIATVAVVSALKFMHLDADFPPGVTDSGVLYTDEGWYSNAALNQLATGRWYKEGDFNPIVNMPIGQLIQAAVYRLCQPSLATARATTVCFSLLLVAVTAAFARKHLGSFSAVLVASLLTVNLSLFAYSRLAVLDIMMLTFIMMAAHVTTCLPSRRHLPIVLLASSLLALAVLTKSTAIFAIPVLAYLAATRGLDLREQVGFAMLATVTVGLMIALYNVGAWWIYPDDFVYFRRLNFESRALTDPYAIAASGLQALRRAQVVEPIVYALALLLGALAMIVSRPFRRNRSVRCAVIWLAAYLALLSTTYYQPDRYFLPVLIPSSILLCASLVTLRQRWNHALMLTAQVGVVVYVISANAASIGTYLRAPTFSFAQMAREVGAIVRNGHEGEQRKVLMGNLADSIGLETGVATVNSVQGTRDVSWRIRQYRPGYYVALGDEPAVVAALERCCRLEQVGAWDVFGNYYGGRNVRLFRVSNVEATRAAEGRDAIAGQR